MISTLILLLLCQSGSLSEQWFPHPSGASAFEDYTRAAEIISTREYAGLSAWQSADGKSKEFPTVTLGLRIDVFKPPTADESAKLTGQLKPNDFLTVCSMEAKEFGAALGWIQTGNGKSSRIDLSAYDQERYMAAMMPYFNSLANLSLRTAYAKIAEGRTDQGAQILVDQLEFTDNLGRTGTGGMLTALGIEDQDFAFCQRYLGHLSNKDCFQLARAVKTLIARPPAVQDQFKSAERFWEARIGEYVQKMSPGISAAKDEGGDVLPGELNDISLAKAVQKLTSDQQQDLITKASAMADTAMKQYGTRFTGPERDWLSVAPENQLFKLGGVTRADDLPQQVAYRNRPKSGTLRLLLKRATTQRVRLRLLEVHTSILVYKWRNGRLPQSLDELRDVPIDDPLTGKTFQYLAHPDGSYDLASLGTADTGPIELGKGPIMKSPQAPIHP